MVMADDRCGRSSAIEDDGNCGDGAHEGQRPSRNLRRGVNGARTWCMRRVPSGVGGQARPPHAAACEERIAREGRESLERPKGGRPIEP